MNDGSSMSVAMLTYSTRARGGVAHALKLSEHMTTAGAEVTLYSVAREDDESALRGYFRDTRVPFVVVPYAWDSDVITRLENMIDAYSHSLPRGHDIYHAQDCVGGTSLARMKRDGSLKKPVFRTVHHVDDSAEPRLFEFERRAVKLADRRFVVSEYWKANLEREFGLDSEVIHNGIDLDDFAGLPPRRSEAPTVLFVGGLEPRKGLEYLVLATPFILDRVPGAVVRAVAKAGFRGVDRVEWFELLAQRAGVLGNIEFHGSVSQDSLLQLYADADVVVLPSRNEGWGLSLMEAMACSKPVVATRVGGVPELVRHDVEGILVEPGDVAGLGLGIASVLLDKGLAERMGAAGRERVAGYSWDEAASRTMAAYSEALQRC
ncbi:MAG: glycosyltransferase [Methanobacteriota archaeon]|nr:MAG: glycosyltransferase [Euryarchaeota archaeon]